MFVRSKKRECVNECTEASAPASPGVANWVSAPTPQRTSAECPDKCALLVMLSYLIGPVRRIFASHDSLTNTITY